MKIIERYLTKGAKLKSHKVDFKDSDICKRLRGVKQQQENILKKHLG